MINGGSIPNHQEGLGLSPVTINKFWGSCLEYDCWLTSKMVDQKLYNFLTVTLIAIILTKRLLNDDIKNLEQENNVLCNIVIC